MGKVFNLLYKGIGIEEAEAVPPDQRRPRSRPQEPEPPTESPPAAPAQAVDLSQYPLMQTRPGDDLFGITRYDATNESPDGTPRVGWLIRLAGVNGGPRITRKIPDRLHGWDCFLSLKEALWVRDEYVRTTAYADAVHKQPPVKGVRLRTGHWTAQCHFAGKGPSRRSFYFGKHGGRRGAFDAAVKHRHDFEVEYYGYALVDLDDKAELDRLYDAALAFADKKR